MGKLKLILGIAVLVFGAIAGWQIGSCELANLALRDDMQDIAAQAGARIGLLSASTDEDVRSAVFREAQRHGIQLEPGQVTVRRTGSGEAPVIYLSADILRMRSDLPADPQVTVPVISGGATIECCRERMTTGQRTIIAGICGAAGCGRHPQRG